MQELEQLIRRFWANQTTKADNERLLQMLEEVEAENDLHPVHRLPPERAASILQNIHNQLGIDGTTERQKRKTATVRKLYGRVAVAAAVCILALSTFLWTRGRQSATPTVAAATTGTPPLVSVINNADSVLAITLEDGSTVQLEKNSSLSYYKPFINDRRDISLRGIALFKVAKDKKRPFTVYAGGIATTALGTRFLVNATDSRKVMVRLLEGKVVVRTAADAKMTMNDVYLTPGQEFSFDRSSRQYVVNATHDRTNVAGAGEPPVSRNELVFHKEPLGKVFEKVGRLYGVSLNYRKEDLHGLYFTGTFLQNDKLDLVLSTICNVNDLLPARNGDKIVITRSH
jgi:transmembrane sensor